MQLEKGVKLKHYKGGKYTVVGQGTHSETLEDMIIYQNDKDKKVWIRPINMFYEEVEYKESFVARFEELKEYTYEELQGQYIKYREVIEENGKTLVDKEAKGWVTNYNKQTDYLYIRCDDKYKGARGWNITLDDVIEVLPYKEQY